MVPWATTINIIRDMCLPGCNGSVEPAWMSHVPTCYLWSKLVVGYWSIIPVLLNLELLYHYFLSPSAPCNTISTVAPSTEVASYSPSTQSKETTFEIKVSAATSGPQLTTEAQASNTPSLLFVASTQLSFEGDSALASSGHGSTSNIPSTMTAESTTTESFEATVEKTGHLDEASTLASDAHGSSLSSPTITTAESNIRASGGMPEESGSSFATFLVSQVTASSFKDTEESISAILSTAVFHMITGSGEIWMSTDSFIHHTCSWTKLIGKCRCFLNISCRPTLAFLKFRLWISVILMELIISCQWGSYSYSD